MKSLPWHQKNSRSAGGGFSLIELLVVVAILGIMIGLIAPAITSVLRASNLANAGDQLLTALSTARHTAIARNRIIEVRLYQYSDSSMQQEPVAVRFQGMQLFLIDPIGQQNAATPIGRMIKFSGSTYIAPDTALSSLLDPGIRPLVAGSALGHTIPPCGLDYKAATFRFYPDGSMNLPTDRPMYLTLVPVITPHTIATPPENFATIVVQATTGKAQLHRP